MKSSGENTESKKQFARTRDRWENHVKINVKEICYQEVSYIQMNKDNTQRQDPVNIAQK